MEMPADKSDRNYIYWTHDQLPSNSSLRNYSFCLDKTKYCALWVAYPMHPSYLGDADRTNKFAYDPDINTSVQANIGAYSFYPQGGSTYSHSRGHQLPSADRTATSGDNLTTFYATNMTPQLQSLNGGQWASLEKKVRDSWTCTDTLYVVTGAYFDPLRTPNYAYDDRGQGKACPVPTHYYKVLLRSKSGTTGKPLRELTADQMQCIGFWFDHENPSSWNVSNCVMSVTQIESLTGFRFFENVPKAPKEQANKASWPGL